MCSGVLPQQPPAMLISPAFAKPPRYRAMSSGPKSNPLSETGFDLGPEDMARYLGGFAKAGLINIAGGCCGNTPEHIAAIGKALERPPSRKLDQIEAAA